MMSRGLKNVAQTIKNSNNFLITSHINTEGDALGSQLAMADILKNMGKRYIIFDNDPVPASLEFLCGKKAVKTKLSGSDKFDVVLSVDCPVVARTGKVADCFKKAKRIINIDHHISNSGFGDSIWVEPKMSSCGEMLYYMYKHLKIPISRKAASYMYVAIATDTGFFKYENTTSGTHHIVSCLIKTGIKPLLISNQLNEKKSINALRLLSETLKTMEMHFNNKVALLYTSSAMLRRFNLNPDSTDGFVNYARSVDTSRIAIFLLERPDDMGRVHVSFRSKGDVDVNKVASLFKGGGHPNASGCLIKGGIKEARRMLLNKVKAFV